MRDHSKVHKDSLFFGWRIIFISFENKQENGCLRFNKRWLFRMPRIHHDLSAFFGHCTHGQNWRRLKISLSAYERYRTRATEFIKSLQ